MGDWDLWIGGWVMMLCSGLCMEALVLGLPFASWGGDALWALGGAFGLCWGMLSWVLGLAFCSLCWLSAGFCGGCPCGGALWAIWWDGGMGSTKVCEGGGAMVGVGGASGGGS